MENDYQDTTRIIRERPLLAERFEVIEMLGEGAAGAVFLVEDTHKDREQVALKVLTNTEAFDENTLQRFLDELHVSQKIRHPNIVAAYDFIKMEDSIAYSMEYVKGEDLSDVVHERLLSYEEIDNIMVQFLSGIQALHDRDVLHRDLKLENILISDDNKVKIVDLGLMKRLNEANKLTRTGILLGTAQYLPPEYIKHGEYEKRSDLYAAGLVLFEMLAGERRLENLNGVEAIDYLLDTGFKVPKVTNIARGTIPAKYQKIIDKALHPNPKKRFKSATEMADAFSEEISLLSDHHSHQTVSSNDAPCEVPDIGFNRRSALETLPPIRRSWVKSLLNLTLKFVAVVGAAAAVYVYLDKESYRAIPSNILYGKYSGTIESNSRLSPTQEIKAEASEGGFFLILDEQGCRSGFVNLITGLVSCPTQGYQVELQLGSNGRLKGQLYHDGIARSFQLNYVGGIR